MESSDIITLFNTAKSIVLRQLYNEIPDNGMHYQWILCKKGIAEKLTYETYQVTLQSPTYQHSPSAHFDELHSVVSSIHAEMMSLTQTQKTIQTTIQTTQ